MYKEPCHYCGGDVVQRPATYIYRDEKYKDLSIYVCLKCEAYCGSHKSNGRPLGIVANSELRKLRMQCHKIFDGVWEQDLSRNERYQLLADLLNIEKNYCHFAMFLPEMCKKALEAMGHKLKEQNNVVVVRSITGSDLRKKKVTIVRATSPRVKITRSRKYEHFPLVQIKKLLQFSKNENVIKELNAELMFRSLDGLV